MRIMIIGGGRLGVAVAKLLREERQDVVLFEKDKEKAEKIAQSLDVLVINADGTLVEKLTDAGLEEIDVFMALTGSDETNLMACQISKGKAKKIVARANREENIPLYQNAGVDEVLMPLISSSSAFRNAALEKDKTLLILEKDFEIVEHQVTRESKSLGRALKEVKFPEDSRIVMLYRDNRAIIPHGETTFREKDKLIILATKSKVKHLLSIL